MGVGGGGEEEEKEKGRRRRRGGEGRVYVSTGNSACMPKNARKVLLLKCFENLS